jgi:DNA-binding transcriptional LysR family regulator
MRASDYVELQAFAAIVRHGNFTRAASHLGQSPSAISQTIRNLEDRLGTRLLNRTTRSVSPTEAGTRLAESLLPLLDSLETIESTVTMPGGGPRGVLRLNANRFAARHVLAPLLPALLEEHPGISVELEVDDALVDVVATGFDAGVRLGERLQNDMVAVPLGGRISMAVVAAPAYIDRYGVPSHPQDLAEHTCIGMRWPTDRSPYRWEFERDEEALRVAVTGPLICDEPDVRLAAALAGLGLVIVFEPEAQPMITTGRLVRVLSDWTPSFPGCFLYFPGRRHMPTPLRAFIDFSAKTTRWS